MGIDMQVFMVLSDESDFNGTSLTAEPLPKNGQFRTVWQCHDGAPSTCCGWARGKARCRNWV